MKRIHVLTLALALLLPASMFAQGIGITLGAGPQKITGTNMMNNSLSTDAVTGYHLGLTYEIPVGGQLYFQPGMVYAHKGAKYGLDDVVNYDLPANISDYVNANLSLGLDYITVPLNLIYKPSVGIGNFVLGAGFYGGYAINGKGSANISAGPLSLYSQDYEVNFDNTGGSFIFSDIPTSWNAEELKQFKIERNLNPVDYGINLMAGFEFGPGISLMGTMQMGLANIEPENSNMTSHNLGYGVSLGFRF